MKPDDEDPFAKWRKAFEDFDPDPPITVYVGCPKSCECWTSSDDKEKDRALVEFVENVQRKQKELLEKVKKQQEEWFENARKEQAKWLENVK